MWVFLLFLCSAVLLYLSDASFNIFLKFLILAFEFGKCSIVSDTWTSTFLVISHHCRFSKFDLDFREYSFCKKCSNHISHSPCVQGICLWLLLWVLFYFLFCILFLGILFTLSVSPILITMYLEVNQTTINFLWVKRTNAVWVERIMDMPFPTPTCSFLSRMSLRHLT